MEVLSIPNLVSQDPDFWPRLGTWLRSTREARLVAREEQWKKKENTLRIAPSQRTKIAASLAPTSLFDCFWRMRIRSNYGTIDPYLVARISESDHQTFNEALCTTTRATVALLELFVLRRVGRTEFTRIATNFIRQDAHNLMAHTLGGRLGPYGLTP